MSKKIIAILTIATIIFVCAFAACDKKDSDSDDTLYVTDDNGDRVLADDGQFLVYETNADGEIVTDESGEEVTDVKMFEPTLEDGVIEDYGFKLTIPKGWRVSKDEKNVFVKNNKTVEIKLVKNTYERYYNFSKEICEALLKDGYKGYFKDEIDYVKGAEKASQAMINEGEENFISTAILNNGNLYVVTLIAPKDKLDIADMDAFLAGFEFKPYTYYPELTAESTEESTEEIITETTTK